MIDTKTKTKTKNINCDADTLDTFEIETINDYEKSKRNDVLQIRPIKELWEELGIDN